MALFGKKKEEKPADNVAAEKPIDIVAPEKPLGMVAPEIAESPASIAEEVTGSMCSLTARVDIGPAEYPGMEGEKESEDREQDDIQASVEEAPPVVSDPEEKGAEGIADDHRIAQTWDCIYSPGFSHPSSQSVDAGKIRKDALSAEEKERVYALMIQFGFLGHGQIRAILGKDVSFEPEEAATLVVRGQSFHFHNERSLARYCEMAGESYGELRREVLFANRIEEERLPEILPEIDILLAYESACRNSKSYRLYHWVSGRNFRNRKSLKIRKETRGSWSPDLFLVLQRREKKHGVLFHFLPACHAFTLGERMKKYGEVVSAYASWLSQPEKVGKWVSRLRMYAEVPHVSVALVFPAEEIHAAADLREKFRGIAASIHPVTMDEILDKPLGVAAKMADKS